MCVCVCVCVCVQVHACMCVCVDGLVNGWFGGLVSNIVCVCARNCCSSSALH